MAQDTKNHSPADNFSIKASDEFWPTKSPDIARWNKYFPYSLVIVKKTSDGKYVDASDENDSKKPSGRFILPIPPESLQFQMPTAINVSATLGGIVEEHNGAPFRMISFTGSTGVLQAKGSAPTKESSNTTQSILSGTIQNVTSLVKTATKFATDSNNFTDNLVSDDDITSGNTTGFAGKPDNPVGQFNGYYQFRKLQSFLENYVNFKKKSGNEDYKLAFTMYKDDAVYLVTPLSFTYTRNAGSPYEYIYSLQLKAWRRIEIDNASPAGFRVVLNLAARDPNKLAKLMGKITAAQEILEGLRDTVLAYGGDLNNNVFQIIRETAVFAKDALGVGFSLIDMPIQVTKDARSSVISFLSTATAFSGAGAVFDQKDRELQSALKSFNSIGVETGLLETQTNELPQDVSSQNSILINAGAGANKVTSAHPVNKIFENPENNFSIFSKVKIGDLNLSPKIIGDIITERNRVRKFTRSDFESKRDTVMKSMTDFADAVGAGNVTYNRVYNRENKTGNRIPTKDDYEILFSLNEVAQVLNSLSVSGEIDKKLDSINFVAGLASQSGIAFNVPRSKFAVPFPYASTLEMLAGSYLSDPDRWIEIAELNGLKEPYVDEIGFDLPLLTNGNGNQITIESAKNLFVGQEVWISSNLATRTKRSITKIDNITTYYIITVDGDADLEKYSTLANATLHAFLPDTVNSQMMIFIPSAEDPVNEDFIFKSIPGINQFDPLLRISGVDLLLTSTNDLVVTPDGDGRLAVGFANIVQDARIKMSIKKGSLLRHPEIGLNIKPGMSTADVTAKDLFDSVKTLFDGDPTFSDVNGISILKTGPAVEIRASLKVAGTNQNVPLAFTLKR